MESRILLSGHLSLPANPPRQSRETSIAPMTPSRNILSFSFRNPENRFATRIRPLVKAASFAPKEAELDCSKDDEPRRKKVAVFVSGGGSNFKKIHEGCSVGSVKGDIVLLVTNKKGINRKHGVDFVLLAGYLKLIPVELVQAFPKRILNIHSSLLPAFGGKGLYGMRVHKAVLASGARYSGPTIHFVDEEYDTGRILAPTALRVMANDTPEELAKRVLHEVRIKIH